MSLWADGYGAVSTTPSSEVLFPVTDRSIEPGSAAARTIAFPRCSSPPCVPVTYQPPQRRSKGVRSSVSCQPSWWTGWPFSSGSIDPTR